MTFDVFKDVVQMVTNVATVLTLLAALFQLRILKGQLLTTTQWTVMQDERNLWQLAIENPAAREGLVAEKFGDDNPRNSASENLIISMLFDHYEKIYYQHVKGAFPEDLWSSWDAH